MAKKKSSKKIDWLINWDKTYDWSGQSVKKHIPAKKRKIEEYLRSYLKSLDDGIRTSAPSFKGHTIQFDWFEGPGYQFIVSAYLAPPATETEPPGGSGLPQLSPTPPPQP